MPDLLVKLYELPDLAPAIEKVNSFGIEIRRALPPEKHIVTKWASKHFNEGWASECDVAFSNKPVSCFIAIENGKMVGFACYEATARNYFGPTGVDESMRGKGIGRALLLACFHALKEMGYGYGIIGGAGPVPFYEKELGAKVIEGSTPGIYKGLMEG